MSTMIKSGGCKFQGQTGLNTAEVKALQRAIKENQRSRFTKCTCERKDNGKIDRSGCRYNHMSYDDLLYSRIKRKVEFLQGRKI